MKIIVYDHAFNANEWFVILMLAVGLILIFVIPPRFSVKETILYVLFGISTGKFFDHTISIRPFDYYDVNDTSSFELIDFISYVMFGPLAYLYVYLYEKLQIKKWWHFLYFLTWMVLSVGVEYVATELGVYHYKNGYHIIFGAPIYLLTQSVLLWIYHHIRKNEAIFAAGQKGKRSSSGG